MARMTETKDKAEVSNLDSERRMHYALMIMSYCASALFVTMLVVLILFVPKMLSLSATSQGAAENIRTASGVWANASADQMHDIHQIATDIRTSVVKFNRVIIPSVDTMLKTSTTQIAADR